MNKFYNAIAMLSVGKSIILCCSTETVYKYVDMVKKANKGWRFDVCDVGVGISVERIA